MKLLKTLALSVVVALASTASLAAYDCEYIKGVGHNIQNNRQYFDTTLEKAVEGNAVHRNLRIGYVEDGHTDESFRDILLDHDAANIVALFIYKSTPLEYSDSAKELSINLSETWAYNQCESGNIKKY